MYKTVIFVEDGSVDLEELKGNLDRDTLVVTYRQGANAPQIQQPERFIAAFDDDYVRKLHGEVNDLIVEILRGDYCKISVKLRKRLEELYVNYFAQCRRLNG